MPTVKCSEGSIYRRYNYWINSQLEREGFQASSFKEAAKKAKEKVRAKVSEGDILRVKWTMGSYSEEYVQTFQFYQKKWIIIPFKK